jgi:predicted transcriptional regulator
MEGFKEFFTQIPKRESESQVVFLYHNGASWNEIQQETGRSKGDIQRILERNNVQRNRLGSKHELINYYKDAGHTTSEIAKTVGMTPQGVNYIIRKNRS